MSLLSFLSMVPPAIYLGAVVGAALNALAWKYHKPALYVLGYLVFYMAVRFNSNI